MSKSAFYCIKSSFFNFKIKQKCFKIKHVDKEVTVLNHKEIKTGRIDSGLKISKVCQALNISRSTYYLIEKGKRKPTEKEICILTKLFGLGVN